ncbi:HlyD family secretion protein [Mesorhizobium sp. YC-39]|uniref:HlyD family secretion protein n=1 Tax=unclassified Mesorhizobium TaxID=325217 RepID=UPI0021E86A66|nr:MULTISPECIES: HlyD family secretion protein [unclassified Mesorhizobium]MCV3206494.1 HlyD family secretion protein [Mesorhizobium sp. YC-2]MCV3227106.1 HlyD family secretion protein [Mesorhizobium sp. YC-39]
MSQTARISVLRQASGGSKMPPASAPIGETFTIARAPNRTISTTADSRPGEGGHGQQAPGGPPPADGQPEASVGSERAGGPGGSDNGHRNRRPAVFIVGFIVLAALVLGGSYYWYANLNLVSTDDAYVDGRVVTIAPQVSGLVVSLDVTDNQYVHRGDPLIHIDPRSYMSERNRAQGTLDSARAQAAGERLATEIARKNFPALFQQAQAQLATAQANLTKAQSDYDRQSTLPKAATTQQEVDAALAALRQSKAQVMQAEAQVQLSSPVEQHIGQSDAQVEQQNGQVEQAQAQLDQAELNLSWTVVTAPQDGWITRRNVEMGNYVMPGQQIFSIVPPDMWITANFKENQLDGLRPGQSVKIDVDAYPRLDLRGHVDSIQMGSGSKFTAFPPENATGNFVKIVQRVPVKIVIDSGLDPKRPLPLGISVVPTVSVR